MEVFEEACEVMQGSAETIYRPRCHHLELSPCGVLAQGIECGALLAALGTANPGVAIDLNDLPTGLCRDRA